jgi:predicted DNA binding CopG/RHH family protein
MGGELDDFEREFLSRTRSKMNDTRITVWLPSEVLEVLRGEAAKRGLRVGPYIRMLLVKHAKEVSQVPEIAEVDLGL